MAGNQDSGDKTEKATPKKLRDARKKGDIPKSKDLTSTVSLILSVIILWFAIIYLTPKFSDLMAATLQAPTDDFASTALILGKEAAVLLVQASLIILLPAAFLSLFIDFLQVGPLLTFEKLKPELSKLNPVSGVQKMFSADNMFELLKSIVKTAVILLLCGLVTVALMPGLVFLPAADPAGVVAAFYYVTLYTLAAALAFLLLFAALDVSYQHYSFSKKMKMSMREIKQEYKDTEGDPLIKGHRRQTAQEWAQEGASEAAGSASVLVVNPTHVAVALRFEADLDDVPIVTAMGEDDIAQSMRDAAKEKHIPVVRNVQLARRLLSDGAEGEMVPRELFDVVAEIIFWAQSVNKRIEHEKTHKFVPWDGQLPITPGEDLTQYPEDAVPPVLHRET